MSGILQAPLQMDDWIRDAIVEIALTLSEALTPVINIINDFFLITPRWMIEVIKRWDENGSKIT